MDILKLSSKTYLKLIGICLIITIVTGTIYYFTKGGFFDGVLLTFVGLSCTYLILILSVLLFKILTNLIAKDSINASNVVFSFIATVSVSGYLFMILFKLVSGELNL